VAACRVVAQHGLNFYLPFLWPALRAREEPPKASSNYRFQWAFALVSARAHYFGRGGKRNREPGR
jgi:hypothetical protein